MEYAISYSTNDPGHPEDQAIYNSHIYTSQSSHKSANAAVLKNDIVQELRRHQVLKMVGDLRTICGSPQASTVAYFSS